MLKKIVLILPLLFAAPANAANLLANSGFETGSLSPWTVSTNNPVVTTAEAHTGQYSVAAFSDDAIRQDFAAVATSQISQVSFWVKRAGGPYDGYDFYYDDGTSQQFFLNAIFQGDDWLFFDLTANLAENKNLTGFRIFGTSPGPAYLDDFTIEAGTAAVPEPSAWAMMLLGFGVAGGAMRSAARRRRLACA
jgi:hypothetical protein